MASKKASKKKPPKRPAEYEVLFEKVWKYLVCNENGRIDKTLLMQELADFSLLMQEASKVYHHVTGGRISSAAAFSSEVIAAATEADNEALQEVLKDEREKWESEHACEQEVCYVALGGKTTTFVGRHARVTTPDGTFIVAWCSDTDQLFVDEETPLPHVWRDTARDAIKALLVQRS